MLYTLSKVQYSLDELSQLLSYMTKNDALILWQDGILQAVKYPQLFVDLPNVFALENDVKARGLSLHIPLVTLSQFVDISEKYSPQLAL